MRVWKRSSWLEGWVKSGSEGSLQNEMAILAELTEVGRRARRVRRSMRRDITVTCVGTIGLCMIFYY